MSIAKEMFDAYFKSTGRIKEQPKKNTSSKTSSDSSSNINSSSAFEN